MAFELDVTSQKRLDGIHPDLARVIRRAAQLSPIAFKVTEGMRTLARQKELVAQGASKTMNSRHLTGHAVDLAPVVGGTVRWDWPLFHQLAPAVKQAAAELKVPIEWGGDWRTFKDGPHFQLPFSGYPK